MVKSQEAKDNLTDSTTAPPSFVSSLVSDQYEHMQTLTLIALLAEPERRKEAAHALARHLGAEELIVFVKDLEVDLLLPAPGFVQTLPRGQLWHAFLAACIERGQYEADLPFPDEQTVQRAVGFMTGDTALVLLGRGPLSGEVASVRLLLPLLHAALAGEQAAQTAKASTIVAQRAAKEAQTLATSLDGTRTMLQEALTELYRLQRQKDEFLAIASHELRTPLTTMKGLTQLTRRKLERAAVGEAAYLQLMERSIARMERLISDLLDVTRIDAGKLALRSRLSDLVEICQQAVEEQRLLSNRKIVLELSEAPVPVEVDAERIHQVLSNFLSNALKYTDAQAAVTVLLRQEDNEARVIVRDEGEGIPEEAIPHLFERFYRVDGAEVKNGSQLGLGLGLYICRAIIEMHHGQVGVESRRGQGASFWFTLPLPGTH
jgi:signal transduction histidine kinase